MSETLFLSTVTKEFGEFRKRLARFLERASRLFTFGIRMISSTTA